MSLSKQDFDDLNESDLVALRDTGVPEGVLTEYKQAMYGGNDADVKEFLKDLTSFANTSGGHLIIGIEEDGGVPTSIPGLSGDPDTDLQRLESLARDGIEPRISGLRMKAIPLAGGGYAIALRVPKSWNPPHRVSARNTNRIYGRNSAGAHEYSVEELRVVFTSAAASLDRVRAFRAERLAKIDAGEPIVPLITNNGRLVMHVVPLSAFGVGLPIDLDDARALQAKLGPMESNRFSSAINFDGFVTISGGDTGYTQFFRNGCIEAVKVRAFGDLHQGKRFIPAKSFGNWIFNSLPKYLETLRDLSVAPPLVVMLTLQGVRGVHLGLSQRQFDDGSPIDRAVLELPEIVFEQYGDDASCQAAMRPAFDALWNAAGYPRCMYMSEEGLWNPPNAF